MPKMAWNEKADKLMQELHEVMDQLARLDKKKDQLDNEIRTVIGRHLQGKYSG